MSKAVAIVIVVFTCLHLGLVAYFFFTDTYPWWLLAVNLAGILFLLGYCLRPSQSSLVSAGLYLILFCLALWLRLYRVDQITPGMWGDEITSSQASLQVITAPTFVPFVPINFGHPTPLFYLEGWLLHAFGKTVTVVRFTSVFFGALSIPLFFYLSKKITAPFPALVATLMFLFAYNHIVVSRLAYEMTAAMCFQLLAGICLYFYHTYRHPRALVGLGVSLGLGLYTYLGFRTTAAAFFIFILVILYRRLPRRRALGHLCLFLASLFITGSALTAYALRHPANVWERTAKISVFNAGLPAAEVAKELLGATYRTLVVTFVSGDPNPRHNPSRTAAYDYLSTVLLVVGLIGLVRSPHRYLRFVFLLLIGFTLLNDLPTLERIPEFHYYGLGHPNTLRLSFLTPLFYLVISYALFYLYHWLPHRLVFPTLTLFCLLSIMQNYQWYFNQPPDPYNYRYNGAMELRAALLMQQTPTTRLYVSPDLVNDPRVQFFNDKTLIPYQPASVTFPGLPSGAFFILDPFFQPDLTRGIYASRSADPTLFIKSLTNPQGFADTLLIRQF